MTLDDCIEAANAPDAMNPLFELLYARSRETPAKVWHNATPAHDAIFRALRIDRRDFGAFYAALPFRLHRIEGKPVILAAIPCPHFLDDGDDDWLRIETVLAWDPTTDTATVLGDAAEHHIVGRLPYGCEATQIHASPFGFFRAIAEARAQFFGVWCHVGGTWKRRPAESDDTPGLLLIGDPAKVSWPLHTLPADLTCHGIDAKAINRAMLRQARIPRAVSAPTPILEAVE